MISTKRTVLKSLSIDDAKDLFSYRSLREVFKYQCWAPKNISDAEDFVRSYSIYEGIIEGQWKQFGIYSIKDKSLIGDCGFRIQSDDQTEIGYTIAPSYQRKGIGSEIVESLIDYLFNEMLIQKIIAKADPENIGSIKVLKRLGFRKEAHLVKNVKIRGEWKDDLVYAVLREEWIKIK